MRGFAIATPSGLPICSSPLLQFWLQFCTNSSRQAGLVQP
jgi:hypothetical protein